MNKVVGIAVVFASVIGCAGYQGKLDNAQAKAKDAAGKVVCRAKVVAPYVDFILEADLPAVLDGADISDVLAVSGAAKEEVAKVKEAFAACGKIEL